MAWFQQKQNTVVEAEKGPDGYTIYRLAADGTVTTSTVPADVFELVFEPQVIYNWDGTIVEPPA